MIDDFEANIRKQKDCFEKRIIDVQYIIYKKQKSSHELH